jgi:hypothetical protein
MPPGNESDFITFWIKHPSPLIYHASGKFGFYEDELEEYKDILNWPAISGNTSIEWTSELIDRYLDNLLVRGHAYTKEEQENLSSWNIGSNHFHYEFHINPAIPWSEEFIDRYKDHLSWFMISQYPPIHVDHRILDRFKDYWDWWFVSVYFKLVWDIEFLEKYQDKIHYPILTMNSSFYDYLDQDILAFIREQDPATHASLESYLAKRNAPRRRNSGNSIIQKEPTIDTVSSEDIETAFNTFGTQELLSKKWIPWSSGIIDYYADKIDWIELCDDPEAKLTEELIEKYIDRVNFGFLGEEITNDYSRLGYSEKYQEYHPGISRNSVLPWSIDFIRKYENQWFWEGLTQNSSLPWNKELIEAFIDKWDWEALSYMDFWTIELILQFSGHLNWSVLSDNESLDWNLDFLKKFEANWDYNRMYTNESIYKGLIQEFLTSESLN